MSIHESAQLLKPAEVGELLRISKSQLWLYIASGEIPSLKIGNSRRFRLSDVKAFIESRAARSSGTSKGGDA